MKNLSRRDLLKGALTIGGAAVGARLAGPFVRDAVAAAEPSHFVHIFFPGGINGLFTGCAQQLRSHFGITDSNMTAVGNGVFTDKATFGTFPQVALDHWGAIGVWHHANLHTLKSNLNGGGELAMLRSTGNRCYLNDLASAMGGSSAFQCMYMGDRPPAYRDWDSTNGVNLQRLSDLKSALSAAGEGESDPNAPDRAKSSAALEAAGVMSAGQLATNPGRLTSLGDSYRSVVEALTAPPPPPVTFAEIDAAYGLGGRSAISPSGPACFATMLAGAEIMIRAAGASVINIQDFAPMWDFSADVSGPLSRDKFTGTGAYAGRASRAAPIKTFLDRMLNLPGHNVVVAISGEFVRLTVGHGHGDGVVAAVFGKYVKQGLSFPVDANARFNTSTPGPQAFWAAVAAALRVPGAPFGANPHALIV